MWGDQLQPGEPEEEEEQRSELVGYAITLKAQPLADPTNSCPLYSSCKVRHRVSANPKQWNLNEPATSTLTSYSENSQSCKTEKSVA
ncbi:hypothetical protein GH733_013413 [Mirounga leonina]|nr:hypothetical protein GH733_013413 [Mirounga leonina]